jgi:hypothetical protein
MYQRIRVTEGETFTAVASRLKIEQLAKGNGFYCLEKVHNLDNKL